ncbi:phage repressor protein CI [Pantoea coffeiphila]|uniref:Phage repressor protein n=1 Tax=Pantoea coffeiphila TaxID=1465635 RepID=A0A2S9IBY1_9GAMM|nr:phage repressor protein CI [Pantoea coffeiphila]PRD15300.1 phage repressor protein [Pantoea coffeiphila]
MSLHIDFDTGGAEVLNRVCEAYGFKTKIALADHIGIASSSLAMRYKRGNFPSDIVVRCMAETGANLEWLASGVGPKVSGDALEALRVVRKKIVDGQLYDSGILLIDPSTFLPGTQIPKSPMCVIDGSSQYIVENDFTDVYDDEWIVEIEDKISVRTLTCIPVKKVRVTGGGAPFDCSIADIKVLGRIVLTIR